MTDKESLIELQNIDCNCNNCIFMDRDMVKFKASLEQHHKWQFDYFNTTKNKLIEKANFYKKRFYDLLRWNDLLVQSDKMKFQFEKINASINYGHCNKFKKDVTFIPNTLQLETQKCFENRNK